MNIKGRKKKNVKDNERQNIYIGEIKYLGRKSSKILPTPQDELISSKGFTLSSPVSQLKEHNRGDRPIIDFDNY